MTAQNRKSTISSEAFFNTETRHFNLWWQATFLMLGLLAVTLLLWGLDHRQLDNASVWAKPIKFEVSLAMYFVTLALLSSYLPARENMRAGWQWATRLAVVSGVFEVIYILIQAARGRASHYNNETPTEAAMYGLMGLGAVILVAVSFYLGYLLYRDYRKERSDNFKLASAYGLMLGSVLTLFTASVMSSGQNHFAGTPAADALQVPLVGWVLSGGDLRIPHFFATHLMQFLPLYGLMVQSRGPNNSTAQKNIMVFALAYSAAVLAWFAVSFII